ncbi:MAG: methylenetetrahydrofolate reductase [Terrimicrobiaceae bacterium]|nr:methylenetetrahydrofolate reductase [Terrimicrobiaceae bacterium]
MRLDDLLTRTPRTLSFEFFPPRNERGWHTLEDTIEQLIPHGPDFVSVTYGAGGGTREKTREVIEHIAGSTNVSTMAHLTCVNATKAELRGLLDEYAAHGIENLLALRGDPPKGETRFAPTDGGCEYASDLIELIREDGRFATLCAAFPEKHPDAASREADWENLHRKFEKGACAAITQCFFVPHFYVELRDSLAVSLGRTPRILPGILPVTDWNALVRFCRICGASIPAALRDRIEPVAGDPVEARKRGIAFTADFCRRLLEADAPGLHFYALNRSTAVAEIVTALRESGHLP